MNYPCRILLLLILLYSQPAWAQQPFFRQHKMEESLKNLQAKIIFADRQSHLWFGSPDGLLSYDGEAFHPIPYADSTLHAVSAVYEDLNGQLWAGHEDGSIYISQNKQQLYRWEPEEGTPVVPITGFAEDAQGNLWLATYGEGLYCLFRKRLYNFNREDGLPGNDIYALARAADGSIWAATDNGISICGFKKGEKAVRNLTTQDGLPDEIVKTLLPTSDSSMWIGTHEQGICRYDLQDDRFSSPIGQNRLGPVSSLEFFHGKEIWIGTEGNGLFRYDLLDHTLTTVQAFAETERAKIYDLHKDVEGNIWVLNNQSGIVSANRQFEHLNHIPAGIQALVADRQNQLWVGTAKGLFTFDAYTETPGFKPVLAQLQLNVISLYQDTFGIIWAGTFGQGLYALDPLTGSYRHFDPSDGLTNPNILSIDGQGNVLWLATLGGVTEFELKGPASVRGTRNFNQESGLGTNFIYKVFVDSRGNTWFGTDGKGAAVLKDGQLYNFPTGYTSHGDSIALKSVYSIAEDERGHIWISTPEGGIFELNDGQFRQLTVKEGLRNLTVTGLTGAETGEILIVHPKGIDLLNPETRHLIYYDNEVGISDLEPNLNALCKDRRGNIWIGDQETLIRYTPLQEELAVHPRIILKNVSVFLDPVDFRQKNRFSHRENNLVFDYIGLWYTDPQTVKYRYIMEGFDRDWITSSDKRKVYSNLPPGEYTFRVSATENDAFNGEPIASYSFEIQKPFWTTWWFLLLSVLLIIALINLIIRIRARRLYRINALEKEKIQSQFEALKNQINPHFLFNSFNTLITIIEEDPKAGVRYVEHFSDFFRDILQYRETDLIPLEEELKIVENYSYLLRKRYGKNLYLQLKLDDQTGYVPPLTLQILIENAIKHNIISRTKPLTILIERQEGNYLLVQNNRQAKYTKPPSTGLGLQNIIQRYAHLSDRKVFVEPEEHHFRVRIPIIQKEA